MTTFTQRFDAATVASFTTAVTQELCRCCQCVMNGSDHCPACGCEQFEERCTAAQRFEMAMARAVARFRSGQTDTETCRCDGAPMNGSDHCSVCGCEEFEEQCPFQTTLAR